MRFLSFKIFVLCIIFPPICYILTAYIAERTSHNFYTAQIEDIYTGDLQPLLMGNVRLKNVITQNIDNYLKARHFIHLGLKVDVTIVTKKGTMFIRASSAMRISLIYRPIPCRLPRITTPC